MAPVIVAARLHSVLQDLDHGLISIYVVSIHRTAKGRGKSRADVLVCAAKTQSRSPPASLKPASSVTSLQPDIRRQGNNNLEHQPSLRQICYGTFSSYLPSIHSVQLASHSRLYSFSTVLVLAVTPHEKESGSDQCLRHEPYSDYARFAIL